MREDEADEVGDESKRETVDLPVAIPPVRPTTGSHMALVDVNG